MTNPCFSFFCTSFFRTSLHGRRRSNYHSLNRDNEFLIIICGTIFWWQLKFDECMFSTSCLSFTPNIHFHTLSLLKRCFDHPWNVTSNLWINVGLWGFIHVDYLLLLHVFNQWHSQIENIRLFSFYFKSQCMVDISVMLILMRILIHIYIYIAKQIKHIFVSLLEAFQNLTYII